MDPSNQHIREPEYHRYLDNELSAAKRQAVDSHLSICELCSAQLDEIQLLFDRIAEVEQIELWIDLAPRVIADILERERLLRRLTAMTIAQVAFSIIVLVVFWPFLPQGLAQWKSEWSSYLIDIPMLVREYTGSLLASSGELAGYFQAVEFKPALPAFSFLQVDVSMMSIAALLVSAAMLWLVGNRVLLPQTNLTRNHSNGG
ncbi:MAG: zf-HC2 domain-containing protein [Anaerolineae bacterium]|nr:zf-HC2 domain-containing protein [Anaerolineae bacterium]